MVTITGSTTDGMCAPVVLYTLLWVADTELVWSDCVCLVGVGCWPVAMLESPEYSDLRVQSAETAARPVTGTVRVAPAAPEPGLGTAGHEVHGRHGYEVGWPATQMLLFR